MGKSASYVRMMHIYVTVSMPLDPGASGLLFHRKALTEINNRFTKVQSDLNKGSDARPPAVMHEQSKPMPHSGTSRGRTDTSYKVQYSKRDKTRGCNLGHRGCTCVLGCH